MSECHEIEENFETLKELFVNMSQAIIELEEHKAAMEESNRTLKNANDSLQETVNRLLLLNDKQQTIIGTLNESLDRNMALQTELDSLKKEYLKLKNVYNTENQNIQESCKDKQLQNSLDNCNLLLQNKIHDLEKQNSNFHVHDIILETGLNNINNINEESQREENNDCNSPMAVDVFDQNEFQLPQVSAIDSDTES